MRRHCLSLENTQMIVEYRRLARQAERRCISIKYSVHSEIDKRFMRLQRIARRDRIRISRRMCNVHAMCQFPFLKLPVFEYTRSRPFDPAAARNSHTQTARKIASGKMRYSRSRDSPPRKMECSARQPCSLLAKQQI